MLLAPDISADSSNIELCDSDLPLTTRPLIADILRTRYCVSGSVFLVEGIDAAVPVRDKCRGVRLLLGDGELCIQGLLRPPMHGFVDDRQISAGCYVRLDKFQLCVRVLARAKHGTKHGTKHDGASDTRVGLTSQSNRRVKESAETMVYLLVENLVAVGWDASYLEILGIGDGYSWAGRKAKDKSPDSPLQEAVKPVPSAIPGTPSAETKKKVVEIEDDSDLDGAFEEMEVSLPRATQKRQALAVWRPMRQRIGATGGRIRGSTSPLPWLSGDITQPVKLTALRSIPNLPKRQNWTVNVLAVIHSLSEVESTRLPPHHKRTARLVDPSTSKKVLLTVFLDPELFNPTVGSAILLLGLKNHRFDGGSLNKYASDRSAGSETGWWLENPHELQWCDVAGLNEWWRTRYAL